MSLLFGIIVGFSLGLTGGGGSIFAVPLLVYGLAAPVHQAVVISLAAVGCTALAGQSLDKAITTWFVLGGLGGMGLGILLSRRLAGPLLQKLFAGMMVAVAVYMLLRNF